MTKFADLHMHSNYSDGEYSPKEIVKLYKNKGFAAISITDHDNLSGIPEALLWGEKLDVEVIPGLELSSVWGDEEIHILGYFIDLDNKELNDKLNIIRKSREKRIFEMVQKLKLLGYNISWDEFFSEARDGSIGRPHIAQNLLKKGYVKSIGEAFDKLLSKGRPAFVPRYKILPQEAIELIKNANGLAVLAHPGLLKEQDLLEKIIPLGIDGLEVWHTEHSQEEVLKYLEIAQENKLLITGGSDWHGKNKDQRFYIGNVKLDYKYVQELKKHRV